MRSDAALELRDVRALDALEARNLYVASVRAFATFLDQLDDPEWQAVTRCDPWTVKDTAGHLLGWNAAFTSVSELTKQIAGAFRYRKRFGNMTDAQNEAQVDLARSLAPSELIAALRDRGARAARIRYRLSRTIGFVPIYFPYLGGWQKSSYLLEVIFLRDLLMHRSDCADATGRDPHWDQRDRRVMIDMVTDWATRTDADVTIELNAEGVYRTGTRTAGVIKSTLPALALHLGNRAPRDQVLFEGDVDRIERWLAKGVPV